jgi:aryl-alcohol dehydrogenase-like predicted oxidoreductase
LETRHIGSLEVSVIGLGCNNFGRRLDFSSTSEVINAALDAGITYFDTADIYGGTKSEEFLGRALRNHRDKVVIATKFGMKVDETRHGARPDYVKRACHDSLRRLDTDYIDLYQLHQPDPTVPIADTLGALNELAQAGMVREIGCSNFSRDEQREAKSAVAPGARSFASVQNEFSLLHREPEREVIAECRRLGMAFIPYFPLASGLLSGKYRRGKPAPKGSRIGSGWHDELFTHENLDIVESLIAFAESKGHSMLELAISWLASHDVVASVIAGATSANQVRANAVAGSWRLTAEEMRMVDSIAPA